MRFAEDIASIRPEEIDPDPVTKGRFSNAGKADKIRIKKQIKNWPRLGSTTNASLPLEGVVSTSMSVSPGSTPEKLGRYVIQKRIGSGSMGSVWLAKDPTIERVVAIKLIQGATYLDPTQFESYKTRFYREAQAAGKLLHPGIVTVFDIGHTDEETPFIVMEYVPGRTLTAALEEGLGREELLQIAFDLLDALAYAHSYGVVHRDLKPANVLITNERHAKITDFGIAHVVGSDLTPSDQVLGSPYYMAPEQLWKGPVDQRTDLFAFGVVFYRMVTGKLPFVGDSFAAVAHAVVTEEPVPPDQISSSVSADLGQVILRCLAKQPEQRFTTAEEIKEALASVGLMNPLLVELEAEEPGVATDPEIKLEPEGDLDLASALEMEATRESKPRPNPRQRLRAVLAVPALIGILLAAFLLFSWGKTSQPETTPPQAKSTLFDINDTQKSDVVGWEEKETAPTAVREEPRSTSPKPSRNAKKLSPPVVATAPIAARKASATPPKAPSEPQLFEQARSAFDNGQLEQSKATLDALLAKNPEFAGASALHLEVTDLLWKRTLPISFQARHNHRIGGCNGELILESGGLRYVSEKHGEWRWSFEEILSMDRKDASNFNIETAEKDVPLLGKSKNYKFKLLDAPLDEESWSRYQRLMSSGIAAASRSAIPGGDCDRDITGPALVICSSRCVA